MRAFVADTLEFDQNVGINHTHIFSPRVINDLRLGWNFDPQLTDGNFPDIPWVTMNVAGRSAALFNATDGFVFPRRRVPRLPGKQRVPYLPETLGGVRGSDGLR